MRCCVLPRAEDHAVPGRRPRHGFTLLELLVVLAIIATLATLVGPSVFRNVSDARVTTARSQIDILSLALNSYFMDNGAFPTSEQGLEALREAPSVPPSPIRWRGPYLSRTLAPDPWGRPYVYQSPGKSNPQSFDLYSLGRDGAAGGEGEDADVTSWGGALPP
jgi:general secretion pathway protein G